VFFIAIAAIAGRLAIEDRKGLASCFDPALLRKLATMLRHTPEQSVEAPAWLRR
jgi:hypothetical protein